LQVHALPGVDGDFKLLSDGGFEARGFGGNLVAADANGEELIGAGFVGLGRGFDAGANVGQLQFGFGDPETGGVANDAQDGGGVKLSTERHGQKGQQVKRESTHRLHNGIA
jgi:hypothetical protein